MSTGFDSSEWIDADEAAAKAIEEREKEKGIPYLQAMRELEAEGHLAMVALCAAHPNPQARKNVRIAERARTEGMTFAEARDLERQELLLGADDDDQIRLSQHFAGYDIAVR